MAVFNVGKALSLALGAKGVYVTVVDFSEEKGKEVAALIEKENLKFHTKLEFPTALFIRCDVTNSSKFLPVIIEIGLFLFRCLCFQLHLWKLALALSLMLYKTPHSI